MTNHLVVLVCLFAMVIALPPSKADETVDYLVNAETVTTGTSNGFQNEGAGDSVVNTKTEANNGTATVMMALNGDVSTEWNYVGPTPLTTCIWAPTTLHWPALSGFCSGEPDANTSYVTSLTESPGDADDEDVYSVSNPGLATGTVITSVVAFIWARENVSQTGELPRIDFAIEKGGLQCGLGQVSTTLAWVNYTLTCANSYDGDAWTVADFTGMQLHVIVATNELSSLVSMTYAGVVVTYQLPYMLDIDSHINVPTELVTDVEIFLSCSLTGDTEGASLQIQGTTVATNLCIAPNIDTRYKTDARGDVVVRMYSNPDTTQTVYSIDLLIARVTTSGGGISLLPPAPVCSYNAFTQYFDCIDSQNYGGMNVQWVRWQVDGGGGVRGDPNGRVSLPSNNGLWSAGSRSHVITATAVYLSGAEVTTSIVLTTDDSVRLVMWLLLVLLILIIVIPCVDKLVKWRKRR